jgi:hypothetical protein
MGDHVSAKWGAQRYKGHIKRINKDGTYTIHFDCDNTERDYKASQLNKVKP